MPGYSIHSRLLIAASVVLALFLGLGGVALNGAFLSSIEQATQDRLMGHVYALLGAAKTDSSGRMRMPEALVDPRFSHVDSGLYAEVVGDQHDEYYWRSHSLIGRSLPPHKSQAPGKPSFLHVKSNSDGYYLLGYSLIWEDDSGKEFTYHIVIGEDERGVLLQAVAFRERLWFWLGGGAIVLLLAQGGVLAWGLRPLRSVSDDLEQVQNGSETQLTGRYPRELNGLTKSVNSLIQNNYDSRERYRNSLGDLAHSLKTPLAVLQGVRDGSLETIRDALEEQIPRMDEIVQYQLKRAAAGGQPMGVATDVSRVIQRLVSTLDKVYRNKAMQCRLQVDEALLFLGDEGDLLELLGNVIENAYKYGKQQLLVTIKSGGEGAGQGMLMEVVIEDDGAGIPMSVSKQLTQRGVRGDQSTPGQGIGLSVAQNIVDLYQGQLNIRRSSLGGAAMVITLPAKRIA